MAAVAPYILVAGAAVAPVALSEDDTIGQCLYWIGFRTDAQRLNLVTDSLGTYDDIRMLSEKDISEMATDWSTRPPRGRVAVRISFGTRRTKLLKALTHWVQDFYRVSDIPHVDGLNEASFRAQLDRALARSQIRVNIKSQTKTAAEAASPGPLESERKWKQWEEKFINYARAHLGANGIPLSYVVRENDAPNIGGTFPDFITQTIECAPLTGEFYEADRLSVFNMIVSFTIGQPSGDWIKATLRYSDGRRSMKALRDHFEGAGNASRNKADADQLSESLHYKSERSMTFETFLTQCQKMYNIYEKEGEPYSDDAKVRFLFKKVQHRDLSGAIEALRVQQTAGTNVTYAMATSHLSTAVSRLPEYKAKNRNISGVGTQGNGDDGTDGIYNSDGSIKTGHIPNWKSLSKEDQQKVKDERKRLGNTKGGNKNNHKGGTMSKSDANQMKQLKAQNKKYRRQIKAIKRKSKGDDNDDDSDGSDDGTDAGDEFGGRNSKKKKKGNNK